MLKVNLKNTFTYPNILIIVYFHSYITKILFGWSDLGQKENKGKEIGTKMWYFLSLFDCDEKLGRKE